MSSCTLRQWPLWIVATLENAHSTKVRVFWHIKGKVIPPAVSIGQRQAGKRE